MLLHSIKNSSQIEHAHTWYITVWSFPKTAKFSIAAHASEEVKHA
jgi:hypothetical protein